MGFLISKTLALILHKTYLGSTVFCFATVLYIIISYEKGIPHQPYTALRIKIKQLEHKSIEITSFVLVTIWRLLASRFTIL